MRQPLTYGAENNRKEKEIICRNCIMAEILSQWNRKGMPRKQSLFQVGKLFMFKHIPMAAKLLF